MAERLDDVLSELIAAQDSEPAAVSEEAQSTEPAPAEVGEAPAAAETPTAGEEESAGEPPEALPNTEEPQAAPSGEAPPAPSADPRNEALLRATEAINGLRSENAKLRASQNLMQQRMTQLQKTAFEANKQNEEAVEATVLKPPVLDLAGVQYLGDEARQKLMADYSAAMADYTRQSILKELQPMVDQYERQTREAADAAVRNQLAGSGRLPGFSEDAGQIEKIIATTPGLANLPPETKYALGYVIHRGVQAMNAKPAEPETAEQLVARVLENPDAMKAIEKQRAQKIAAANKNAPPVAASQGQHNAPAAAQNPPQDFNEARSRARKLFGL